MMSGPMGCLNPIGGGAARYSYARQELLQRSSRTTLHTPMLFPQSDRMNERRSQGDKVPDVPREVSSTSTLITWRRNSRQIGLASGLRLPATRHGKWPAHIAPKRDRKSTRLNSSH